MQLNKVQLIGNLTRDPELKSLPNGTKVCAFSMATNEVFTKDGQRQERAEYHNIVAFGKTAENIARFMRKGSQLYIEGKLQTRSWEKDGEKKYRTEIIANIVQFGAKPAGVSADRDERDQADGNPHVEQDADDINLEDIPF